MGFPGRRGRMPKSRGDLVYAMDSYPHRDFGDRSSRAAACGSVANLGSVSILSQKSDGFYPESGLL